VTGGGDENDIVIDAGIGDVAPQLHPRAAVAPAVVLAHVVADGVRDVLMTAGGQDVTRAVVVMRVVVLHHRVGDVPVEVVPSAVGGGGGVIVVALAIFDGDTVGPRRPDANGRSPVLAIIVCDAAGDPRAVDAGEVDARAGHAARGLAPRAVPGVHLADQVVLVDVVRHGGDLDPAIQVVVEVGV